MAASQKINWGTVKTLVVAAVLVAGVSWAAKRFGFAGLSQNMG